MWQLVVAMLGLGPPARQRRHAALPGFLLRAQRLQRRRRRRDTQVFHRQRRLQLFGRRARRQFAHRAGARAGNERRPLVGNIHRSRRRSGPVPTRRRHPLRSGRYGGPPHRPAGRRAGLAQVPGLFRGHSSVTRAGRGGFQHLHHWESFCRPRSAVTPVCGAGVKEPRFCWSRWAKKA